MPRIIMKMFDPNTIISDILDTKLEYIIDCIWFLDTGSIYDGTNDLVLFDNGRSKSDRWFFINTQYYPVYDKKTGEYIAAVICGRIFPVCTLRGDNSAGLLFAKLRERGVTIPRDLISERRLNHA